MKTFFLLVAFAATASAMCPDSCSGHGTCGSEDTCSCYSNWQGANCNDRTCPFSYAFVDSFEAAATHGLTAADNGHWYAECSNKGLCDRKTGQCECFEGYEGKACRRSSCPNGCSGHGTCEFMNELGTYHDWDAEKIQGCQCDGGYEGPDCSLRKCPRGDDPLTHTVDTTNAQGNPTGWTAQINEKQTFGIFYADGFRTLAAHGTASSTTAHTTEWINEMGATSTERQVLGAYTTGQLASSSDVPPHEFTLSFTDTNGHTWTTMPIEADSETTHDYTKARNHATGSFTTGGLVARRAAGTACTDASGGTKTGQCLENDIKEALESLPNRVIDEVTVTVTQGTCGTNAGATAKCSAVVGETTAGTAKLWDTDTCGVLHAGVTCGPNDKAKAFSDAAYVYTYFKVVVEFTGAEVSGNQNTLGINIDRCVAAGCQPVTRGFPTVALHGGTDGGDMDSTSATNANWRGQDMWVSNIQSLDGTKEANECSDRGSCDKSTGLCTCFSGYTGQMCQSQTAIV